MNITGSVRKRKKANGGYYWQLTAELGRDAISQKRIRRYRTVEGGKRDAERALREFLAEIEKGYYVLEKDGHIVSQAVISRVLTKGKSIGEVFTP